MIKFNSYIELIDFFKNNKPQNAYTERHHIIPKFEGGTYNSKYLVQLTFEYHVYAHILLYKESTNDKSKNLNLLACQLILNQPKVSRVSDLERLINDTVFMESIKIIRMNVNKCHRIIINNGTNEKHIFKEELDEYLNSGWKLGRVSEATEWSRKGSKKGQEAKKLNGTFSGFKIPEERKKLISKNTKIGMEKARNMGKQIGRTSGFTSCHKGKIQITDGIKNRYIFADEPIPTGWHRGSTQNHKNEKSIKRVCLSKNGIVKYVPEKELEHYLLQGWKQGRSN